MNLRPFFAASIVAALFTPTSHAATSNNTPAAHTQAT